ncbi:putative lipoprotein/thioderoxin [Polaribacter irgensii 23-P]|uniref:Putative lipoprotein/thioderoxin n=1 Tax=Polaribacter irgensii 23-P TaxID=313594 RepID=A4BZD5_9FLAO|nr:TlpA disulfide reductase family protein [Polaribacter irgensii]EAR12528.1 putative lipoprotein/thioderoxin [Polaribacter irgensii 23-P]
MKKISFLLLLALTISSCKTEHSKEYFSILIKLENNKDSVLTIASQKGIIKTIKIQENGTFKDTLRVPTAGVYTLETNPKKRAPIFLKNGFDLTITGDSEKFMTSFEFAGTGAENNAFILAQISESQRIGNPALILALEKNEFRNKLINLEKRQDSILGSYKNIDSVLVEMANQQMVQMINYFNQAYSKNKTMAKGTPSPEFKMYTNFKGPKKSLSSFAGKYVYIDIWATWCGPCIQQIPFIASLEKEYHSKNIEFVSISTDESRRNGGSWEAAENKWRSFVKSEELTGTQLWAGEDISFQQAYQINSIPRFILVDPKGNIVDANAPRPSDPKLKELFTSLGI